MTRLIGCGRSIQSVVAKAVRTWPIVCRTRLQWPAPLDEEVVEAPMPLAVEELKTEDAWVTSRQHKEADLHCRGQVKGFLRTANHSLPAGP